MNLGENKIYSYINFRKNNFIRFYLYLNLFLEENF